MAHNGYKTSGILYPYSSWKKKKEKGHTLPSKETVSSGHGTQALIPTEARGSLYKYSLYSQFQASQEEGREREEGEREGLGERVAMSSYKKGWKMNELLARIFVDLNKFRILSQGIGSK